MICIAENQKMGVLAPKSIVWGNIWVEKLLFVGFADHHPSTWEQGRGKALRLGARAVHVAVVTGGVQSLGPLNPCCSPLDQDIAEGGEAALRKGCSQL